MDPRRTVQQILCYQPTGHRDIGRPKRRWEGDLEMEHAVIAYLEGGDNHDH
jgi:hypothetical protein